MGLFIDRHVRVAQTDTCAFTDAPPLELGDSTINIGIVLLVSLIVFIILI